MADVSCLLLAALGVLVLALLTAAGVLNYLPRARGVQAAQEEGRLASVDGLRGYLALFVYVSHSIIAWFWLQSGQWQLPPYPKLGQFGSTSVALFFMVTAFLFWGRVLDKGDTIAWTELYLARVARLVPLYAFALLCMLGLCFVLAGGRLQVPADVLVRQLLHWVIFTLLSAPDLNGMAATRHILAGVVWSLRYEWMFYLGLPALALLTGARRALGAALFGLGALAMLLYLGDPATFAEPTRLFCFVGGILAAWWVRRPALRAAACRPAAAVFALTALIGEVALFDSPFGWKPLLGLTVFFTVVASGNDLFGSLRIRAAVWLGEISYSVYLLHGLLLWLVFRNPLVTPLWQQTSITAYCMAVLGVAMVLVVFASSTCIAIEWPGIRLGRSLCLAWRNRKYATIADENAAEVIRAKTDI